jgi:hypothetical protein
VSPIITRRLSRSAPAHWCCKPSVRGAPRLPISSASATRQTLLAAEAAVIDRFAVTGTQLFSQIPSFLNFFESKSKMQKLIAKCNN